MSSREPHSYWQMLFPNATCFFSCRLFEHGVPPSVSVQFYFLFFLPKNCSVPQEGGGHGAGCNSTTPPMKTIEASVWVCCTENFRRSARRAAGCRKMMRDLRMSMTNHGNGRRTTSLKLLQVATEITTVLDNILAKTAYEACRLEISTDLSVLYGKKGKYCRT